MAWLSGCGDRASSESASAASSADQAIRIVSLSPAISRTLVDFGFESLIVGRTPHCESLDRSIPAVGDLLNIDYERLARLHPTHILVQPPSAGIDPQLVELAQQRKWRIGQWRLNTIEDIEELVCELPGVLYEHDSAAMEAAAQRAAELLNEIAEAVSPGDGNVFAGRTMLVHGVDPVLASGVGTYLHDVLIAVGGRNAVDGSGWVSLSMEDVVRLNPEAIVIVTYASTDRQPDAFELAGPLATLEIDAARNRRIAVVSHPDAFMPCSGVVDVAKELRRILQELAEPTA